MSRPAWDQGATVVKRVPEQDYRLRCTLKVVNVNDGIRTSWDKDFDQANQGRDTTTDESRAKVEKIASNLDYAMGGRVMEFTGTGAPLVAKTGDVLDGNHHMQGIREGYRRGGEKAAAFREAVLAEAGERGLEVDEHAAEAPVIVCEIESVEVPEGGTAPTVAQIAADTNVSVQRGMNETETASKHAKILLDNNLIPRLEIDRETGLVKDGEAKSIGDQAVDPIGVFIQKSGEQGMLTPDRRLTEHGQKVLLNAITMALLSDADTAVAKSIVEKAGKLVARPGCSRRSTTVR